MFFVDQVRVGKEGEGGDMLGVLNVSSVRPNATGMDMNSPRPDMYPGTVYYISITLILLIKCLRGDRITGLGFPSSHACSRVFQFNLLK